MEEAVAELCRRIDSGIKTHVVYVNAAKVVLYHKSSALRNVMERADLLLADGMPVVWLSHAKGTPLPCRVAGVDLMERIVAVAAERGYRLFLLGSKPAVVSRAAAEFQRRYPYLKLAGYRHGYFTESEEARIVAEINNSKADLVLIGMGTPQKELWADRNLAELSVSVCQGVGGGFDVVAGVTTRAPRWMQRAGLEWFYRFFQEPGRMWKRYVFSNAWFIWLAMRDLSYGFKTPESPTVETQSD